MARKSSKKGGCLGILVGLFGICVALVLYSFAWIPAIIAAIYFIFNKKRPNRTRNIAISIAIVITSLVVFGSIGSDGSDTVNETIQSVAETETETEPQTESELKETLETEMVAKENETSTEETQNVETELMSSEETQMIETEIIQTEAPIIETEIVQTEASEPTVWIPSSGSKYHSRSGCSGMNNPTEVTLSHARSMGYEACKRCH